MLQTTSNQFQHTKYNPSLVRRASLDLEQGNRQRGSMRRGSSPPSQISNLVDALLGPVAQEGLLAHDQSLEVGVDVWCRVSVCMQDCLLEKMPP